MIARMGETNDKLGYSIPGFCMVKIITGLRRARVEMVPFSNNNNTMAMRVIENYRDRIDEVLEVLEKIINPGGEDEGS